MGPGNGVSIGVSANTGQFSKQIAGVSQGLGKLAQTTKSLFGGNNAQQVNAYNKHLNQLERNLERINQRMKTLQGTQAGLIQQQRQLQSTGGPGAAAQLQVVQKALQQNQRSMAFWQAKQVGAQTGLGAAQQNRPGVGGGGGGIAGFFAGQFTNVAGSLGGTLLKAIGIGAAVKGAAEVISKSFMTALDEQKGFADLAPRMRFGVGGSSMSSPKGYMNVLRDMSMPLGYSGIEALKIGSAMSSGSSARGLLSDTHSAMQMGRMFGIDAGGQASMLAEGGKMGAFVPGQAKRFAEMLAREISVTGLGPRAQEVQEATLMLMHRQLATSATASPAGAMALQTVLAKSGLPGFQGAQGAGVLSNIQSAVTGMSDDPSIAFLEATARDQMGVTGYYNMRRLRDKGILGEPKLLPALIQQSLKMGANRDASKDILTHFGLTFPQVDELDRTVGLENINQHNVTGIMKGLKGSGGLLDKGAKAAGALPGNQFRQAEATVSGTMGRLGTPIVQMAGTLAQKASEQITDLMKIFDENKKGNAHLSKIENNTAKVIQKIDPTFPTNESMKRRSDFKAKYGINPEEAHFDRNGNPVTKLGTPLTPMGQGIGDPANAAVARLRKKYGPPVLPGAGGMAPAAIDGKNLGIEKRSDSGKHLHIHVSFDHTGAIHHHAKMAFHGMVKESLDELQRQEIRGNLHHRYPRA